MVLADPAQPSHPGSLVELQQSSLETQKRLPSCACPAQARARECEAAEARAEEARQLPFATARRCSSRPDQTLKAWGIAAMSRWCIP
jgi:hypothetical protein